MNTRIRCGGHFVSWLIAGWLIMVVAGCRDPNWPEHFPVNGTVTLDGKPLSNAGVMFMPRGNTRGNTCIGMTDEQGNYTLSSEQSGEEGAPEGEFAVTISKMKEPPPQTDPDLPAAAETGQEETLSSKYWDSDKTVLSATVPKGGGKIDFPLKSAKR